MSLYLCCPYSSSSGVLDTFDVISPLTPIFSFIYSNHTIDLSDPLSLHSPPHLALLFSSHLHSHLSPSSPLWEEVRVDVRLRVETEEENGGFVGGLDVLDCISPLFPPSSSFSSLFSLLAIFLQPNLDVPFITSDFIRKASKSFQQTMKVNIY